MNTNDMRREFEAWLNSSKAVNGYDSDLFHAWQAATERATALERERCAVLCETHQVTRSPSKGARLETFNSEGGGMHEGMTYAKSIRQGNDK